MVFSDEYYRTERRNMIRANEAKKKAENYMGSRIEKELSMINVLISEASNKGKFSIWYAGRLHELTVQRLEELGYKVETSYQYNEVYYSVRWE